MARATVEIFDTEPGKIQVIVRYDGEFDPESEAHQHTNHVMTLFDKAADPAGPRMHWTPEQRRAYDMVTKMGGSQAQALEAAGPGIPGAPDGMADDEPAANEADAPQIILVPND